MPNLCRAVCSHCFRTFVTEIPKEREFCWECGQGLTYISGEFPIEFDEEGKLINTMGELE